MKRLTLLLWSLPLAVFFSACTEEEDVNVAVQSDAAEFIFFRLDQFDPVVNGEINKGDQTILLKVSEGTDVTSLVPIIEVSAKASVSPQSGRVQDFSQPVTYTVTAEAGNTVDYLVTVEKIEETPVSDSKSDQKRILSFDFNGFTPPVSGTINDGMSTISLTVPWDAELDNVTPTIVVSEKASVSPESGVTQDFNFYVFYTVTAEDGTTRDYTVTIIREDAPAITAEAPEQKEYAKGDSVTIKGTNFFDVVVDLIGESTSYTEIPTIKSKTELSFAVPSWAGVDTGVYQLQLRAGKQKVNLGEITITPPRPEITEIDKTSVTAGGEIQVSGSQFSGKGNKVYFVKDNEEKLAYVMEHRSSYLEVVVPPALTPGDYHVKVVTEDNREVVSSMTISVIENTSTNPFIMSVNETTLKWGKKLIITGKNFEAGKFATIGFMPIGGGVTFVLNPIVNSETEAEFVISDRIRTGTYSFYIEQSGKLSNKFYTVTITE